MKILKIFTFACMFTHTVVNAEWVGNMEITHYFKKGNNFYFGVASPPSDTTCRYHGYHFRIPFKSDHERDLMEIVMLSEVSSKKINIWFEESLQKGDCSILGGAQMAVVKAIGTVKPN